MTWKSLTQTWHYVEKWAASKPEAEALVFEDERLTWHDFKARTDLIAKAFLAAGTEKGDRIAMLSMARNEFLTTFMAAGKVGAIWLGMSPKFTLDELRFLIDDCRPKVLIALREYLGDDLSDRVSTLMNEFDCVQKVLVIGEPFEGTVSFSSYVYQDRPELEDEILSRAALVSDDDETLLLYTSGSTGKPKGVVHTHRSIVENIKVENEKFFFDDQMRGLIHFPINHVAADVELGFAGIMAGGFIACMDRFDPVESLKMIEREKLTVLGQVPVMYLMQIKEAQFRRNRPEQHSTVRVGRRECAEGHDRRAVTALRQDRSCSHYRLREHRSLRVRYLYRQRRRSRDTYENRGQDCRAV